MFLQSAARECGSSDLALELLHIKTFKWCLICKHSCTLLESPFLYPNIDFVGHVVSPIPAAI